ncbi:MAG: transporter [Kiritimatiellae bacterium]|nr:transporter [Kiritimatiellia bacterium]
MCRIIIAIALLAATALSGLAVDVYDGVRAPPGLYYLNYLSLYYADTMTDSSGDSLLSDFRYRSAFETARLSWYSPNLMATVLLPFGYAESGYLDDADTGFGDVTLAAGGFLPVRRLDVLALLAADAPTGSFDEEARINIGTGQWNIRPSVFVHKEIKPCTFDGVVKYNFRLENEDTNFDPGDEWIAEALVTRQFGGVKVGPGLNWLLGDDSEQDGHTLPDSARHKLSAGLETWSYVRGVSLVFNYMADVYAENSARGHLFRFKLVKKL